MPPQIGAVDSSAHRPPTASATVAANGPRIADAKGKILELEYSPPVLTLPTEIVSEIFVHFLPYPKTPSFTGRSSPNVLGQICSNWREIALSTPSLWRAITLHLWNGRRLDQKLRLLEIWLQRSGSRLLSIRIYGALDGNPFAHAIAAHSDRWEHLRIDALNDIDLPIPTFSAIPPHTFSPLLRSVAVSYWGAHCLRVLPWSQLTALTTGGVISPYHCLVRAHNLVYCKLCIEPKAHQGFIITPEDAIALPRLETLIFEWASSSDVSWIFLDLLTLPALQRLQIGQSCRRGDPDLVGLLQSLISRSGCSIQELYVAPTDPHLEAYTIPIPLELYRIALPTAGSIVAGKLRVADPFTLSDDEMDGDEEASAHSDGESDVLA
ncbi:hypothetical protein B0H16DRAFT_1563054 [Mycena metata]|uniref:F-box domain-containing protein n=1 Tax=Mycena metata TaxID=1033252 RepID=A0AAD7IID4_9AGAR|nr:hypothetical protein B0H16DRAFT_1563054 [Mycena metata]